MLRIHDGVRPLISKKQINSLNKVKKGIGVVPVVPVIDSIRKLEGENISANIDRTNLFKVQTPQCFLSSDIKRVFILKGTLDYLLMIQQFLSQLEEK